MVSVNDAAEDELVYYATKDSQVPKGRVSLSECTIGISTDRGDNIWDGQMGRGIKGPSQS